MRKLTMIVLALCLLTAAAVPAAAELKIGYIDTVKIFSNFKETIEAEEIYKKEVEVWKKQAEEMEAELARMREEIQSQSLMLVFDQRMTEYQKYMQDIFGENGEAARRNKELTEPIVEKINGVIEKVAEEEGFTLVLDSSQGVLVYADKEIDITDMIIARLEAQMETTQ